MNQSKYRPEFAAALQAYRREPGATASGFAKKIGISYSAAQQWARVHPAFAAGFNQLRDRRVIAALAEGRTPRRIIARRS